jgi:predicted glycosyltransferase involved in capsule biosynthesis
MKVAVVLPIYLNNWLHQQFISYTVRSIKSKENNLVFIPVENFVAPIFLPTLYPTNEGIETVKIPGKQPQSVARAWNEGIKKAVELGCEYILVLNADIIIKSNSIDKLIVRAEKDRVEDPSILIWTMAQHIPTEEDKVNLTIYDEVSTNLEVKSVEEEVTAEHPNFSAYMVHKTFFDTMGSFDENFEPAYFEDNEMVARIALMNKKAVMYVGSRFFHYGSRTINVDMEFRATMPPMFDQNREYFAEKWSQPPVNEPEEMRKHYYKFPYDIEELPFNCYIPNFWEFLKNQGKVHISDVPKENVIAYLKEKGVM